LEDNGSSTECCRKRGVKLPPGAAFCIECGQPVASQKSKQKIYAALVLQAGLASIAAVFLSSFTVCAYEAYYDYESGFEMISITPLYSMTGSDLVTGTAFGSFPMMWLVIVGSALVLVCGFLGIHVPARKTPSTHSAEKALSLLASISGILILLGSTVVMMQFANLSGAGLHLNFIPDRGVLGEAVIGTIIAIVGQLWAHPTMFDMRKQELEARPASTWAQCPYCKAGYFYDSAEIASSYRATGQDMITCQNCARSFELGADTPSHP